MPLPAASGRMLHPSVGPLLYCSPSRLFDASVRPCECYYVHEPHAGPHRRSDAVPACTLLGSIVFLGVRFAPESFCNPHRLCALASRDHLSVRPSHKDFIHTPLHLACSFLRSTLCSYQACTHGCHYERHSLETIDNVSKPFTHAKLLSFRAIATYKTTTAISALEAFSLLSSKHIMSSKAAYVTLLTAPAYLPGVLVLHETLRSVGSKYPLVTMVTPSLSAEARAVVMNRGIAIRGIEHLYPEEGAHNLAKHDARFRDTWTKLRYG